MLSSQLQLWLSDPSTLIVIAAVLGVFIGYLITWQHAQKQIQQLRIENVRLQTEINGNRAHFEAQLAQLQEAKTALSEHFATLSRKALRENTGMFLRYASQNLKNQQQQAAGDLAQRQLAIEQLMQPLQDSLKRSEQQLSLLEKERQSAYGSLSRQLEQLTRAETELRSETHNLIQALKRPDVRGRWGEMTLKRLAELSGMVEHCDFSEQVSSTADSQLLRPDMVVRMPDNRELIIDAKAPLDAYLAAIDAQTESEKASCLIQHAKNLRERMKSLAAKNYWAQFSHSPDFVILFVPGDQFLSSALSRDSNLMEDALKNNIVLATPSSLIALLRAVAFGWRQTALSENSEKIRQLGEELHQRVATLTEHFQRLGKSLNSSVEHYNKALGSLERQLIPGARKMSELGVETRKPLAEMPPLEKSSRQPQNQTSGQDD